MAKVGSLMGFRYAGGNNFFAQEGHTDFTKTENLITIIPEIKVIKKHLYLIAKPNFVSKKSVQFIYALDDKEFAPSMHTAYGGGYAAMAPGEKYLAKIFDKSGKIIQIITKNIKRQSMKPKEKQIFIDRIRTDKFFDKKGQDALIDTIPDKKNIIGGLVITGKYLLIENIKDDLSDIKSNFLYDIYKIDGSFLGTIGLKSTIKMITHKHLYFTERNEDDDLMIQKYSYQFLNN